MAMPKATDKAPGQESFLASIDDILKNASVSDDLKKHLVTVVHERDRDRRNYELETKKWYSNTPLAIALTGLITILANFLVTYIINTQAASNVVTLEQIKNAFALESAESAASLAIKAEEKKFAFEIVRGELGRADIDQKERAETLLFLARSGVLNVLDRAELEKMAKEGFAPQLTNPTSTPASVDASPETLEKMFGDLVISPDRMADVKEVGDRILAERARYQEVADATGIPWLVVGLLHYREANFDLSRHMNGDPLTARTVTVPEGLPSSGEPPFTWEQSAIEMLPRLGPLRTDLTSVGAALDAMERYNGLMFRRRGIYSPYVWSCSQHYETGRPGASGIENAVAARCGVAPVLKYLLTERQLSFP